MKQKGKVKRQNSKLSACLTLAAGCRLRLPVFGKRRGFPRCPSVVEPFVNLTKGSVSSGSSTILKSELHDRSR